MLYIFWREKRHAYEKHTAPSFSIKKQSRGFRTWSCYRWFLPQLEQDIPGFIFQQDGTPPLNFHKKFEVNLIGDYKIRWRPYTSSLAFTFPEPYTRMFFFFSGSIKRKSLQATLTTHNVWSANSYHRSPIVIRYNVYGSSVLTTGSMCEWQRGSHWIPAMWKIVLMWNKSFRVSQIRTSNSNCSRPQRKKTFVVVICSSAFSSP